MARYSFFIKLAVAIIIFTQTRWLYAQNLVPNPSFEDTLQCPYYISQIGFAVGWYSPTNASPDYYNGCSSAFATSVPNNIEGSEHPRTGTAYSGIYTAGASVANYREYIQIQLLNPLVSGKKYYVSFYASLSDTCVYACNNMGAYFSQTSVTATNGLVLPYTPQISNAVFNPLTVKGGWMLISDTLTAIGGELYITIGNFIDAANSDTVFVGGGAGGAAPYYNSSYYYIDDVSVERVGSGDGINENDNKPIFEVYPNPSRGIVGIQWLAGMQDASTMEVVNVFGEIVYSRQIENFGKTEVDLRDHTNGIYFLRIKSGSMAYAQKIVIQK